MAGGKVERWAGFASVGIVAVGRYYACVSRLLVSGWWRALRQKATVLKWLSLRRPRSCLCLVWEQCPEVMSGFAQATCLSTAVCGGGLVVKILIEMSRGDCNEKDLEMVTRQGIRLIQQTITY